MAESAIAGLFQTPEMYQQAQLQRQEQEAANYAAGSDAAGFLRHL